MDFLLMILSNFNARQEEGGMMECDHQYKAVISKDRLFAL